MLIDAYSFQLIMEDLTGKKRLTNKTANFVILQVLPYPISEVTGAARCFSQLQTVAAVCSFSPCDRLPSIAWCFCL